MNDKDFFTSLYGIKAKYNSGTETFTDLRSLAAQLTTHPETKKYLDMFTKTGGNFYLSSQLDDFAMAYIFSHNIIAINENHFFNPMEPEETSSLISHELHHAFTAKSALAHGIDLIDYDVHYNEKSRQVIHQGLEIGATYHQIVTGFEKGGLHWDFIEHICEHETKGIKALLDENKVYPGNKIPKELLPAIADITTVIFPQVTGVNCKVASMHFLENSIDNDQGKKDISCKKLFEIMECPTTYTEQQLLSLLLFDRRFTPHMSDELKQSVSMAPSGHKPAIQNKINIHFLPIVRENPFIIEKFRE